MRCLFFAALALSAAAYDLDFASPANLISPPAGSIGFANRASDYDVRGDFGTVPPGFGEVAFYWWQGDVLTQERLAWQLDKLAGHSVSGLQINYAHDDKGGRAWGLTFPTQPPLFSPEWWKLQQWFLKEAKTRDMAVSLSDYTLGMAGQGAYIDDLLAKYPSAQGSVLRHRSVCVKGNTPVEVKLEAGWVSVTDSHGTDLRGFVKDGVLQRTFPADGAIEIVRAERVPFSIDPAQSGIGDKVIEFFFQRFEDRNPGESGKGLNFFFSDELSFGVSGWLWNAETAEAFKRMKGYDVVPELAALFKDIGPRTPKIRLDMADVLVRMQEQAFFKPVFDWHQKRGMIYGCDHGGRGRDVMEFGDYFRTQRWNQGPGSDQPSLGRDLTKAKVAASIAHLYQRPRVWLEGFYGSGWGTTSEMVADAVFANFTMGYNLLTLHGLYYTTKGGYWEWAPPCNHFRMPYWDHFKTFMKCSERLGFLMSQGVHCADTAVLYPVAPSQVDKESGKVSVSVAFGSGQALYSNQLDFDFMDFESLLRAEIRGGRLCVSGESYRVLVVPSMKVIRHAVLEKAVAFQNAGGCVVIVGNAPEVSERLGRDDPEVAKLSAQLTMRIASQKELPEFIAQHAGRDYTGGGMINHRHIGNRDVYLVYGGEKGSKAVFRASGRVELWNPWNGSTQVLPVSSCKDGLTELALPLGPKEPQVIVFSPGAPEIAVTGKAKETIIELPSKNWNFRVVPVLDNRFGDYYWPASDRIIGPETRRFAVESNGTKTESTAGFGPKFLVLGPVPADFDAALLSSNPITVKGKTYSWKPYEFSWRYGKEGDPGHQGYHGLKGVITDEFICLGKPEKGKNETVYGPEEGGSRYYLKTVIPVERPVTAYPVTGGLKPAEIRVNGVLVSRSVVLKPGDNTILARYDSPGRGYLVFRTQPTAEIPEGPAPLKDACWIWGPDTESATCRMKKTFELKRLPATAVLRVTGDDSYTATLNGRVLGGGSSWQRIDQYGVSAILKTGGNELVLEGANGGSYCGVIAELVCDGVVVCRTDATWDGAKVISRFEESLWYKHAMGPPKLSGDVLTSAGRPVFKDAPLWMSWYQDKTVLPYDCYPQSRGQTVRCTFAAPPGTQQVIFDRIDGTLIRVTAGGQELSGRKGVYTVAKPFADSVEITAEIQPSPGAHGGAVIPDAVRFVCGDGHIALGDWSQTGGLLYYSGGAVYSREFEWTGGRNVRVDLGDVQASAEVFINGKSAGIRVMQPWTFDVSDGIRPGTNRLEVNVFSALDNHYRTIPSHYKRLGKSGLLGPVRLIIEDK